MITVARKHVPWVAAWIFLLSTVIRRPARHWEPSRQGWVNKRKYKGHTTDVTWICQDSRLGRWKRTIYQDAYLPEKLEEAQWERMHRTPGHWPGLRQHRQARTSSNRLRSSWHRVRESCRSQCPGFCTTADLMPSDLTSASRHQLVCRDKALIRIIGSNHHRELMIHQPPPEHHGVSNKEGNS